MISKEKITSILCEIPDPEIPVITIKDLGVLRNVEIKDDLVVVDITPTYSGCPAMKMIENQIHIELHKAGIEKVKVNHVLAPAWTTDWLTEEAKEKLRKYGIAPPTSLLNSPLPRGEGQGVRCPNCKSINTEMVSQFGSTACKALYKCLDCKEPFDYFKCH